MPVCWEKGVHRTLVTTTHVTNHSFLRKRNLTHGLGAKERPQSLQLKVFRDWHPEHTAARALLQGGQFLLDRTGLISYSPKCKVGWNTHLPYYLTTWAFRVRVESRLDFFLKVSTKSKLPLLMILWSSDVGEFSGKTGREGQPSKKWV